jgi:hypothetical protein
MITREQGEKIASKLGAKSRAGRKHDLQLIYYSGILIAQFGLRRSSHTVGHDYIPRQLHISPKECQDLINCPMSKDAYFEVLRGKRLLPDN